VSCVDRVPTGSRGSVGRDGVATFSRAFGYPADHTRGFARARAGHGHNRSSFRPFTLTLWVRPGPPLFFAICCQCILQLKFHTHEKTSAPEVISSNNKMGG
jgi:hypothetical protein